MDEVRAWTVLEAARWGYGRPACPHCGVAGRSRLLAVRDGGPRRTRTGATTARRVWSCAACRRQFSVLTGTVLQGTRAPLTAWVALLTGDAMGDDPEGLARRLGVAPGTARHLQERVRTALGAVEVGVPAAQDLAQAVLRLPAATAARIRAATPPPGSRVRTAGRGPSADYGT